MLVYARVYVRTTQEIYDCLLGLVRDQGTLPSDVKKGIELVCQNACSIESGKDTDGTHKTTLLPEVLERFRASLRTAVADGGPTEQRALYESSPGALAAESPHFFPNLIDIHRDRAHKWRSIQKGVWKGLDIELRDFLSDLLDFVKMLQTSSKSQKVFKARLCVLLHLRRLR